MQLPLDYTHAPRNDNNVLALPYLAQACRDRRNTGPRIDLWKMLVALIFILRTESELVAADHSGRSLAAEAFGVQDVMSLRRISLQTSCARLDRAFQ